MSGSEFSSQVDISSLKVACKDCNLYQLCLPLGLENDDLERLDSIIKRRRPVKRHAFLYQSGDIMKSIFAVRSGSFKSYTLTDDGTEQITGFSLPGELIGLDAISSGQHISTAKALEMSHVCEIPFEKLEELSNAIPGLQRQLLRIMSKEIAHDQSAILLSKKSAEERLACFIISLVNRYEARGFSAKEINLTMSRVEIASYLGLAVETVSRVFSRFQQDGLMSVNRRSIEINKIDKVHILAGTKPSTN
ncbi:MAG: fumarate/nitrate reduction transcriptional regulator Fnr [Gammaproteobacteria bacterium]|nr:fumarate/nitrate reduction transcriptional regulator Fnr [Gammaproteobacteria bacterium]MDH5593277.1 fumarate/nitrate reduction transcriptional regulator Fnr [Gammaproteobacteria bacterium]MDH5614143.1 fumarate/nitrate reduction transcriptional regulator Fnr [Gammaproteobacteria bacterium]